MNANSADVGISFLDDEFVTALRLRLRLEVCSAVPCHTQDWGAGGPKAGVAICIIIRAIVY